MPKPKGSPKTPGSGRKKGSLNRRTRELIEILEEKDFNPAEKLVFVFRKAMKTFQNSYPPSEGPDMRFKYLEIAEKAASDLMQYVYPKRKAVDLTSNGQAFSFADLMKQAAESNGTPDPSGD